MAISLERDKSLLFVFQTLLKDQGCVTLGYSRLAQLVNVNYEAISVNYFCPQLDALKHLVKIDRMRKIPLD